MSREGFVINSYFEAVGDGRKFKRGIVRGACIRGDHQVCDPFSTPAGLQDHRYIYCVESRITQQLSRTPKVCQGVIPDVYCIHVIKSLSGYFLFS